MILAKRVLEYASYTEELKGVTVDYSDYEYMFVKPIGKNYTVPECYIEEKLNCKK